MRLGLTLLLLGSLVPFHAMADALPDRVMQCVMQSHCGDTGCEKSNQPLDLQLFHTTSDVLNKDGSRVIGVRFAWQGQMLEYIGALHQDGGVELALPPGSDDRPLLAVYAKPGGSVQLADMALKAGLPPRKTGFWQGSCKGGMA